MPARSKSQQRLMGQAYAYKSGELKNKDLNPEYADKIKKLAKSMTKKQLKDFAKTKHKKLPEKIEENIILKFNEMNSLNDKDKTIKVKDLIKYLQTLNPEMEI
jgi:DNA polymerase II small subunit/DNA polymerase delta subunit B